MSTWAQLIQSAGLTAEQAESVQKQVAVVAGAPPDPAWLKALAAIAGWVACLFLAPFFGLFNVYESQTSLGVFGGLLLVLGVVLMRSGKVMFVHHLALAFSLLGTGMLVGAFTDFDGDMSFGRLVLVQAVIGAIAYPLVPSSAYRFLVTVSTAFLIVCWLVTREAHYYWMPAWLVALAAATGLLWAWRARPVVLNALAYAMAFALAGTVLFDVLIDQFRWWKVVMLRPQWVSLPLAVVFIGVVASFTGGVAALRKPWMWGACLVAALMGLSGESGMMIALLLLVISFAWDDRLLAVFAYLFLGGFLFFYYYSLEVPLVAKSWIVGGTGIGLLALRAVLHLLDKKGAPQP
jgi:hypothetical protein